MSNKKNSLKKITKKEMENAIIKSGYLIEQRVELSLNDMGYYAHANPVYKDPVTNKSREYDIYAIKATLLEIDDSDNIFTLFHHIICECINNFQPLLFFIKDSPIPEFEFLDSIKLTGMPPKIYNKNIFIDLNKFLELKKIHHYCKNPYSTQYCSFQEKKDKKFWMALHIDDQYHSFDNIIKALNSEILKVKEHISFPVENSNRKADINIFYPLLILQGDLYSCQLKENGLTLIKEKHIQFKKSFYNLNSNYPTEYKIDIITESHLSEYIKLIVNEIEHISRISLKKRDIILNSIIKIKEKIGKNNKLTKELFENL